MRRTPGRLTDRYVRTGTEVPVIYAGTRRQLMTAMAEAMAASTLDSSEHVLEAVRGSRREVIRVYESGECTFSADHACVT